MIAKKTRKGGEVRDGVENRRRLIFEKKRRNEKGMEGVMRED